MKKFLSFLRFILIMLLCIAAAFIIVWPLWKFATTSSKAYTWTVLIIAAVLIIFSISKKIVNKVKAKKQTTEN